MARTARVVAFSTTHDMAEAIDAAAYASGVSRSEWLREAVTAYRLSLTADGASIVSEPRAPYGAQGATRPAGLRTVLDMRPAIREVCEELGVARLWLFGSAVRDDFDPAVSDFDFQVEWLPHAPRRAWAGELFELQERLSDLLGARVDLGEAGQTRNPHIRAEIDSERLLICDTQR
ncbi:MAG: nucleotidyltransferase family protein [Coriobacteriia bacterium]